MGNKKFKLVAVAGTFDILHLGHKNLLNKAFEIGEKVIIGICSDSMVKKMKKPHPVNPYQVRKEKLLEFLKNFGYMDRARIIQINDPYGPAIVDKEMEAIVVSEETEYRAHEINKIREKNGLNLLEIVSIKMVKAENGGILSSSRIRMGEIDPEGRLRK
ncbi:MAG: phosphopantetheine adenylyltransferase [Candidatus Bathyarchaeia archaeon]